jgi:hypothetical protein
MPSDGKTQSASRELTCAWTIEQDVFYKEEELGARQRAVMVSAVLSLGDGAR